MTQPRTEDVPSVLLLSGRLEGVSVPDLLWSLCRDHKTGVLTIEREEVRRTVCLEGGRIVFASSTSRDDRLGEQFLRQGTISLDQLDDGVARLSSGKRLGTLLVEAGSLAPSQLVEGVLDQVKSIVLDLFRWEHGEYRFDDGDLPTDEVIKLDMKTGELLLEGIHSIRSFRRIRRSVGPPRTIYGLTPDGRRAVEGLELSEGEELLVVRLEQCDATVETLCQEVFLSNFEIYQSLWGLAVLGAVECREGRTAVAREAAVEGNLANRPLGEVLVELGNSDQDGVLYLSHRSLERTLHLRHGRCVFATSNDPDDGLLAYLLRRGVISLRDKEETEKRLLTNKRVGTILLEMGVIDQRDLLSMVQEQLKEIVYDTFRWPEGEYAFVPGPLPSVEEITLEPTLESLVAGGLQRVCEWSRVRQACGELDSPLELTPDYLDVLDAMRAGPEEWKIVTLLRSPSTPRQICRTSELSDFRTCQILASLRMLGAAREAWAEIVDEAVEVEVEVGADEVASEGRQVEVVELDREQEPETDGELPGATPDREPIDPVPVVDSETEPESPPVAADATLAVPLEVVERAMNGPAAEPDLVEPREVRPDDLAAGLDEEMSPSPDRTQIVSREVIDRALAGSPAESEQAAGADDDEPAGVPDEPRIDAASTTLIPREEVQAALDSPDEEATTASDGEFPSDDIGGVDTDADVYEIEVVDVEEAFLEELPGDVEQIIARFNSVQRAVFRAVRSEVGAGAANFVRSCASQVFDPAHDPVADAELRSDGSWEVEDLKRVILAQHISDPWPEYRRLLSQEIESLRAHISEARVVELRRQLDTVDEGASA